MIKIYFHSLEIIMKKRPITDNDISYLFESFDTFFPKFLHEELRTKIIDQIKGNLIVQFKKKSIYPQTLPTLRKKLETYITNKVMKFKYSPFGLSGFGCPLRGIDWRDRYTGL